MDDVVQSLAIGRLYGVQGGGTTNKTVRQGDWPEGVNWQQGTNWPVGKFGRIALEGRQACPFQAERCSKSSVRSAISILRSVPDVSYETVIWGNYWPHF